MSVRTAREFVVRSYFEKGLTIKAIAERSKIGKSALYDYKAKIIKGLKDLDHSAQVKIDELMN